MNYLYIVLLDFLPITFIHLSLEPIWDNQNLRPRYMDKAGVLNMFIFPVYLIWVNFVLFKFTWSSLIFFNLSLMFLAVYWANYLFFKFIDWDNLHWKPKQPYMGLFIKKLAYKISFAVLAISNILFLVFQAVI